MKNKLFCWLYILVLLLPVLTMNLNNEYISEIDNTYLPQFSFSIEFLGSMGNYIDKRIGGREYVIWLYQRLNDVCFDILEHPNYMYGQEGHLFCKGDAFLRDFQHLNINQGGGYERRFANYINVLKKIAEKQDSYFLYILCSDKKTIYPEYYPRGVNVIMQPSRTDLILSELDERKVNYLYSKDILIEAKEQGINVYNKKYDVGHWNDNGAFLFSKQIIENLQEIFPKLSSIKKEDFEVGVKLERYLPTSKYEINEEVPCYESKIHHSVQTDDYLDKLPGVQLYYSHYKNTKIDGPSILVFRDSYLDRASKFFVEYFSESTFASYNNLTTLSDYEEYIKLLQPDIVIFENVERTFPVSILE